VPIYEYQCKVCGHVFEREHGIGEKKKYRCPECSCAQTFKLVSQVGVVFKGTGFYVTDNRKSGNGGVSSKTSKKKDKAPDTTPDIEASNKLSEN